MMYHAPSTTVSPEGLTLELVNIATGRPQTQTAPAKEKPKPRGDIAVKRETKEESEVNPAAPPKQSAETQDSSNADSSHAKFGQASVSPSVLSQYVAILVEALQKNRSYPRDAINREEEGTVALAVKLGSAGDVIEARVKSPSPFESLNAAALKTVHKIGQFPKPPIAEGTSIELTIPMRFKIERL